MTPRALRIGEIVQLDPDPDVCTNPAFCACLMVVTEPKDFGAQGYVQGLGTREERGGIAFYRATWAEMEPTGGMAVWIRE